LFPQNINKRDKQAKRKDACETSRFGGKLLISSEKNPFLHN